VLAKDICEVSLFAQIVVRLRICSRIFAASFKGMWAIFIIYAAAPAQRQLAIVSSTIQKRDHNSFVRPHSAMSHASSLDSIRQFVARTFWHLGASGDEQPRESILIHDGSYCGRRFEFSQGYAVWLAEGNKITFYRADGSFLRAASIPESEPMPHRAAA
jgi:hypothetical protein